MRFSNLVQLAVGSLLFFNSAPAAAGDSKLVQKLLDKEGANGPIMLNDRNFDKIVSGPRDYDILVLLTAVNVQYGCQFCRIFDPAYNLVAKSWHSAHKKLGDGLVLATADISSNGKIFRELKLTQAPNLWIYKKSGSVEPFKTGYTTYSYPMVEDQANGLIDYLRQEMGYSVKIVKPFPWDKLVATIAVIVASISLIKFYHTKIISFFRSTKLWVAITLVSVLLFTSGHMFNSIRKVPYVASDGKGGATYFIGGHSNQLGVETQIIAIAYAILAFSSILLVTKIPTIKSVHVQSGAAAFLVIVIFVTMSFVISKFHIKNGGYPIWLLKL